jgi:P27 family predicted phage terminase small subunit
MPKTGRKPIPTEVKRLLGNPGQRPLPKEGEEPSSPIVYELPPAPDWLGEYGAAEWNRVGPYLIENKMLTEADLLTFGAYCSNVDMLIEAKIQIKERGITVFGARGPVRNPALASFAAASTTLRSLAAEFGMTPSSRARIKLPVDDEQTIEDLIGAADEEDAR